MYFSNSQVLIFMIVSWIISLRIRLCFWDLTMESLMKYFTVYSLCFCLLNYVLFFLFLNLFYRHWGRSALTNVSQNQDRAWAEARAVASLDVWIAMSRPRVSLVKPCLAGHHIEKFFAQLFLEESEHQILMKEASYTWKLEILCASYHCPETFLYDEVIGVLFAHYADFCTLAFANLAWLINFSFSWILSCIWCN